MKTWLMMQMVPVLLNMLTPDVMKRGVDALLDMAEDAIAKSETKVDDKAILPVIATIRAGFDIPDND